VIIYQESLSPVRRDNLRGFFARWPTPPSPDIDLALLANSDYIVLAIDERTGDVVGFITAVSDRVLSAYISFLEVLPTHQHRGIGSQLVRRMLLKLQHLYAVDLLCNPELQSFYRNLGMTPASGMRIRHYGLTSDVRIDRIARGPSDGR
jgi:ribosomal protein S18 acetylase RimI-like enzyme